MHEVTQPFCQRVRGRAQTERHLTWVALAERVHLREMRELRHRDRQCPSQRGHLFGRHAGGLCRRDWRCRLGRDELLRRSLDGDWRLLLAVESGLA